MGVVECGLYACCVGCSVRTLREPAVDGRATRLLGTTGDALRRHGRPLRGALLSVGVDVVSQQADHLHHRRRRAAARDGRGVNRGSGLIDRATNARSLVSRVRVARDRR